MDETKKPKRNEKRKKTAKQKCSNCGRLAHRIWNRITRNEGLRFGVKISRICRHDIHARLYELMKYLFIAGPNVFLRPLDKQELRSSSNLEKIVARKNFPPVDNYTTRDAYGVFRAWMLKLPGQPLLSRFNKKEKKSFIFHIIVQEMNVQKRNRVILEFFRISRNMKPENVIFLRHIALLFFRLSLNTDKNNQKPQKVRISMLMQQFGTIFMGKKGAVSKLSLEDGKIFEFVVSNAPSIFGNKVFDRNVIDGIFIKPKKDLASNVVMNDVEGANQQMIMLSTKGAVWQNIPESTRYLEEPPAETQSLLTSLLQRIFLGRLAAALERLFRL